MVAPNRDNGQNCTRMQYINIWGISTSNSINRIDKIQLRSTSPDGVKIYKYYRLESKSKSSVIEVVCDGNKLSFDDSDQESTSTIITTNTTKNNY